MKTRSLLGQVLAVVVMTQLLCAALLCGAALLHERHTRLHAFDLQLQGRSDSLLGAIQDAEDPDDNVEVDPAELSLPHDDVYAVYNQGGRLLGRSRGAPGELTGRQADGFRSASVGPVSYRVLQREALRVIDRAENGGVGLKRPVTIVYSSPQTLLWQEIAEAVRFYLLAILVATGITVFLLALLLKRALQPLSELAVAAGQLTPPALAFEAPASVMRMRELRPLAVVLSDSIVKLREAFAKEQRFVGDAAHELKTAVAVVRSSVQLLMLRRRTAEEYATGLDRILEDNSRVETLVMQMLHLASMDQSPANAPTIDLNEITATALERLQPVAEERGISLHLSASPVPPMRMLPEHGFTLISNLVLNAIQHSSSGKTVSVSLASREQGRIMLDVKDEGEGISAEALPHIFERFYREDRSRSRNTGGTGLGLSICKAIVDAAGGTISARSTPGHGTCVTVVFIVA